MRCALAGLMYASDPYKINHGTMVRQMNPRRCARLPTRSTVESMQLTIDYEQEADGRWIAEVLELPGVLSYGPTRDAAITHVQALALRVLADRLEHDEAGPNWAPIVFAAAA
jgi:predicted RNase H-like HicB family nuclease